MESLSAEALDALGVAYAAVGRFVDAKTAVRQALGIATPKLADAIHKRLAMYEAGQPYVERPG
jgi:hypothetical protein